MCILKQAVDQVTAKLRRIAFIEYGELHSVKADKPSLRSKPQVAVMRLQNSMHRVLWKPIIGLPRLVAIMLERVAWIERSCASCGQEEQTNTASIPEMAADGHRLRLSRILHIQSDRILHQKVEALIPCPAGALPTPCQPPESQ